MFKNSNQNSCLSELASSGSEQPGPGTPLLGLAKYMYYVRFKPRLHASLSHHVA